MVWRSSRGFGCGKARSRSGKIVVVAHYRPRYKIGQTLIYSCKTNKRIFFKKKSYILSRGNIAGQFPDNVLPPSDKFVGEEEEEAERERAEREKKSFFAAVFKNKRG